MKRLALILAILFGLTSCASTPTLTIEDQAKLVEYEKCLLLQQNNLDTINKKFAEGSALSLVETLTRQAEPKDETNLVPRFEIHLERCAQYRP